MKVRDAAVAEARDWIGTPYRHQASRKGAGTDCLGLVRGVWRAVAGPEPETPPAYAPDWEGPADAEPLLAALARHFVRADGPPQPGDVLAFRMGRRRRVSHLGVLSGADRFVHAYAGRQVCETSYARWWKERLAAAFSFPGAER